MNSPLAPQRRASDQTRLARVSKFIREFGRDVWLFLTTLMVVLALVLAALALRRANNTAEDAKNLARDAQRSAMTSCLRAQLNIPIAAKALAGGLQAGLITKKEFDTYAAQKPEKC